jgi:hypothetical protein
MFIRAFYRKLQSDRRNVLAAAAFRQLSGERLA